ncbi:hypothetical protein HY993_02310 [Candidatus Micrarchaeota archaeon]|nr:hypothetical protein [Candidatus Micrarchaeota archaeon]
MGMREHFEQFISQAIEHGFAPVKQLSSVDDLQFFRVKKNLLPVEIITTASATRIYGLCAHIDSADANARRFSVFLEKQSGANITALETSFLKWIRKKGEVIVNKKQGISTSNKTHLMLSFTMPKE